MDATCKVQDNIHVFRLVHNMCPGFWVHINVQKAFDRYGIYFSYIFRFMFAIARLIVLLI